MRFGAAGYIAFWRLAWYNLVMAKTATFYEKQNNEKYKKFSEVLEGLPYFCSEYFTGIDMRTSVLTKLNYATDLAVFFDFLIKKVWVKFNGKKISELTLSDLALVEATDIEYFLRYLNYYTYRGKEYKNGEKAKARKLSAVRSLFKYFYNKDKLKENVASKVATPKLTEKPIIRLNEREVGALLDNAESENKFGGGFQDSYNLNTRERDSAILTLMLGTGIRVSECVGLNIEDIDFSENAFRVTRKGGNTTILYFSDEIKKSLEEYLVWREKRIKERGVFGENALFLSLQNKRISVRAVENLVKKYTAVLNPLKPLSPHKLRSTYGTALYRKTKDIYVVAEVLGHKDINTTKKHYAAIGEDIKRDAASKVVLRKETDDE